MDDLKRYSDDDQRVGLVITEPDIVLVTVTGETSTLDRFLYELTRFWTIQPDSNIIWTTIDGGRPQKQEPARATLAMKLHKLDTLDEGDPNLGRKTNACSCAFPLSPVS